MDAARKRTNLAVVLKLDTFESNKGGPAFIAHVVLNRLVVDDDGNVCLTAPAGLAGLLDAINELKTELDGLANDSVLWLAGGIALRCSRFDFIPDNNGGQKTAPGGGDWVSDEPPSPAGVLHLFPRAK